MHTYMHSHISLVILAHRHESTCSYVTKQHVRGSFSYIRKKPCPKDDRICYSALQKCHCSSDIGVERCGFCFSFCWFISLQWKWRLLNSDPHYHKYDAITLNASMHHSKVVKDLWVHSCNFACETNTVHLVYQARPLSPASAICARVNYCVHAARGARAIN